MLSTRPPLTQEKGVSGGQGPWGPVIPLIPCAPCVPCMPWGPCGPWGPSIPWIPWAPTSPRVPCVLLVFLQYLAVPVVLVVQQLLVFLLCLVFLEDLEDLEFLEAVFWQREPTTSPPKFDRFESQQTDSHRQSLISLVSMPCNFMCWCCWLLHSSIVTKESHKFICCFLHFVGWHWICTLEWSNLWSNRRKSSRSTICSTMWTVGQQFDFPTMSLPDVSYHAVKTCFTHAAFFLLNREECCQN